MAQEQRPIARAVLVGVDRNPESTPLDFAAQDARTLRDSLVGPGSVFRKDAIVLLTDAGGSATLRSSKDVLLEVNRMCDDSDGCDLVLFYYSGHGVEFRQNGYLLAPDSKMSDLERTAVSVREIVELMHACKARSSAILLDACRVRRDSTAPGPVARGALGSSARGFMTALWSLVDVEWKKTSRQSRELLTACDAGEASWEAPTFRAGVWTHFVAETIRTRNHSGPTFVRDLHEGSSRPVVEWCGKNRVGTQTPRYELNTSISPVSAVLFNPTRDTPRGMRALVASGEVRVLRKKESCTSNEKEDDKGHDSKPLEFVEVRPTEDVSTQTTIHLVRFQSERRADLSHLSDEDQRRNREFPLRVYIPRSSNDGTRFNRITLLFNGLAEAAPWTIDDVGWGLADETGSPAVFIPMPRHFVRHPAFKHAAPDPYALSLSEDLLEQNPSDEARKTLLEDAHILATQQVVQEILHLPKQLLHGHEQIIGDAQELTKKIRDGIHPYWSDLIEPTAKIALAGYSIGGFAALALLLMPESDYHSVFLIESGAPIDQIDAGMLLRRNDRVQKMLWKEYRKGGPPTNVQKLFWTPYPPEHELTKRCPWLRRERDNSEAYAKLLEGRLSEANIPKPLKDRIEKSPWAVFDRSVEDSREIWRDIVSTLYEIEWIGGDEKRKGSPERNVFQRVFLGYGSIRNKRDMQMHAHRILIITGGGDEIFSTRLLLSVGPETGLAILRIPGITHWIKARSRPTWTKWLKLVLKFMDSFHQEHPKSQEPE